MQHTIIRPMYMKIRRKHIGCTLWLATLCLNFARMAHIIMQCIKYDMYAQMVIPAVIFYYRHSLYHCITCVKASVKSILFKIEPLLCVARGF